MGVEKFWKQANPSEASLCAGFCSVLLDPAEETSLMDFGDGGGGLITMSNSCDPMDYSPPASSVHEISQARILEWVATGWYHNIFMPNSSKCIHYVQLFFSGILSTSQQSFKKKHLTFCLINHKVIKIKASITVL